MAKPTLQSRARGDGAFGAATGNAILRIQGGMLVVGGEKRAPAGTSLHNSGADLEHSKQMPLKRYVNVSLLGSFLFLKMAWGAGPLPQETASGPRSLQGPSCSQTTGKGVGGGGLLKQQ